MAQWVKILAEKSLYPEFDSQNLQKGRRTELTSQSCPMTSTCMTWHRHTPEAHAKAKRKLTTLYLKFLDTWSLAVTRSQHAPSPNLPLCISSPVSFGIAFLITLLMLKKKKKQQGEGNIFLEDKSSRQS